MKIAISSSGDNLESNVDARFGRCPYFAIVEIQDKKVKSSKFIKNIAATQMGGAGLSSAELVGNQEVSAIITQNVGPKAFSVFNQLNINIYIGSGKISQVIEDFINGKLEKINQATGPTYMGK